MRIDENLPVGEYLRRSKSTPDGVSWIIVCVLAVFCLIDLYSGLKLVPLARSKNIGVAGTALIFSPLLTFLVMVFLRGMIFGNHPAIAWVRAFIIIAMFFVLNF